MAYWLMKSEPGEYAWEDLVREGRAEWDGVRNAQASNNLKAMRVGDRAFFYHSGAERAIAGVMAIARAYYPDPTDPSGRFGMVDVAPIAAVERRVTLAEMRGEPRLAGLALLSQPRLSVVPLSAEHWRILCAMAGVQT